MLYILFGKPVLLHLYKAALVGLEIFNSRMYSTVKSAPECKTVSLESFYIIKFFTPSRGKTIVASESSQKRSKPRVQYFGVFDLVPTMFEFKMTSWGL